MDHDKEYLATEKFRIQYHGLIPLFLNTLTFHDKNYLFLRINVLACMVLGYPFLEILGTHLRYYAHTNGFCVVQENIKQ